MLRLFKSKVDKIAMPKIQILLIDDHKIVLEGTASLLSSLDPYTVAATASSGKDAIELLKTRDFDILVTDYELPDFSGLDIIRVARSINPEIKVIVLSMHDDRSVVKELLKENIDSFVLKNDAHSSLVQALEKVSCGKKYLTPLRKKVTSPREKRK